MTGANSAARTSVNGDLGGSTELFSRIEEWWGARFDDDLISRIADAPAAHLAEFSVALPSLPPLLEIQRPRLRPIVAAHVGDASLSSQMSTALRLLLYSHEVVIDSAIVDPLLNVLENSVEQRKELRIALSWLMHMRPLIEDGSVHITPLGSKGRHPSLVGTFRTIAARLPPDVLAIARELAAKGFVGPDGEPEPLDQWDTWEILRLGFGQLAAASGLARLREGHLLARSELDQRLLEAMLERPSEEARVLRLATLARLNVPVFDSGTADLVRIRQHDEHFAEWRQALGMALDSAYGVVDDSDDSADLASSVVREELSTSFARLQAANRRSAFLSASKGQVRALAVSGVSAAAAGAVTGSPLAALASGVAASFADGLVGYVEELRRRRSDRAILDVVVSFQAAEPDR